jgi:hypothetical protein
MSTSLMWCLCVQALEALHGATVAVWHLQRVLAKKRDPLSHVLFLDALEAVDAPLPLDLFWCVHVLASCVMLLTCV